MEENGLINDLDLLFNSDFNLVSPEQSSEVLKSQNNVTLLDDNENDSENNLVTSNSILDEYTKLENDKNKLELDKLEFEAKYKEIFDQYNLIQENINNIEQKQSEVKEELTRAMEHSNEKNIHNDMFKVTFVAATVRENFDKDKFKRKYPVLFNQFIKKSDVKAYVKIKEL